MSNLIEKIISKDYKTCNEMFKKHIYEIATKKLEEKKKMMAARDSEKNLDEGIMSSIKRIYNKVSGNQQKRLVGILNKKLDDRQIKTLGHLIKNNKTEQGLKSDYAELFRDSRYNDLNKRYMRAADPKGIRPYEYLRNKYLSGHKKTGEKEKNFFRGKQQNEELTLPSGKVMTATRETSNQSVIKQRRGQV